MRDQRTEPYKSPWPLSCLRLNFGIGISWEVSDISEVGISTRQTELDKFNVDWSYNEPIFISHEMCVDWFKVFVL